MPRAQAPYRQQRRSSRLTRRAVRPVRRQAASCGRWQTVLSTARPMLAEIKQNRWWSCAPAPVPGALRPSTTGHPLLLVHRRHPARPSLPVRRTRRRQAISHKSRRRRMAESEHALSAQALAGHRATTTGRNSVPPPSKSSRMNIEDDRRIVFLVVDGDTL